jgi:hypothetical protein
VALVAAWVALLPARSQAQTTSEPVRRRVLLLADKPGDSFVARIKAEVASLGLEVVTRAPAGPIETDARTGHAIAAIRMLPSRRGVEVWMADETSGRSLLRQVVVDETPTGPDQNLIALQTAELLRTSFFPKSVPSPKTNPALAATAVAVPAASAPPAGENAVQVGAGPLYSAGGPSTAWQLWLSAQRRWGRRLGFALDLGLPISRGTLTGPEGSADVGAIVAGGALLMRFENERQNLFLAAGVGAAFVSVLVKGHPSQGPLKGTSSAAYTGLGSLRASLGWKPRGWLGLGISGLAGATASRVRLRFAGNDAGTWGLPILAATMFAELDWR